jgi:hypothetical protein
MEHRLEKKERVDTISVEEYLKMRGNEKQADEKSEEKSENYSSLSSFRLSVFAASSLCVTL